MAYFQDSCFTLIFRKNSLMMIHKALESDAKTPGLEKASFTFDL